MASYTPNYQLHQWESQDPFLRTDFNEDLKKIDIALAYMPKFLNGSYTGTGTAGPDGACELHFGFTPKMVILNTQTISTSNDVPKYYFLFRDIEGFPGYDSNISNNLTWLEDGISWFYDYWLDDEEKWPERQFNAKGRVYKYIAVTW